MRFLFSIPLPLLLILVSFVSFVTKAAPHNQSPSAIDPPRLSTTDNQHANSSYANDRYARLIGLDELNQVYDDVKPMAIGSEGGSSETETDENNEQLSFEELEKKKEQAEKDYKELETKVNEKREELKKKEDDAKDPLEEYERKKKAYEDLKATTEGMNKDLKKAEDEFKIAERNSKNANLTFNNAASDLSDIVDGISEAQERIRILEGEPDELIEVRKNQSERTTKCGQLKGKEIALSDDVDSKKSAVDDLQKKYNAQVTTVNECTGACVTEKGYLTKLEGELKDAKNKHQTAVDLAAYLSSCKNELNRLRLEEQRLVDSIANQATKIAKEKEIIQGLEPKKDPQQVIYDAAKQVKDATDPIFAQKLIARDNAIAGAPFTPEQVQAAEAAVTVAENQWGMLKEGHTKLVEEIDSLKKALEELEKRFANDGERVGALKRMYEAKLGGKEPAKGSAATIAICVIVAVLFATAAIAIFFVLKRRKAAKKDVEKKSDAPSTANQETVKAAAAVSKSAEKIVPPSGTGSTEKAPAPAASVAPLAAASAGPPLPPMEKSPFETIDRSKLPEQYLEMVVGLEKKGLLGKLRASELPEVTDKQKEVKKIVLENIKHKEAGTVHRMHGTLVFTTNVVGEGFQVFENGENAPFPHWDHMEIYDSDDKTRPWLTNKTSYDRTKFKGIASRLVVLKVTEGSRMTSEERRVKKARRQEKINAKKENQKRDGAGKNENSDESSEEKAEIKKSDEEIDAENDITLAFEDVWMKNDDDDHGGHGNNGQVEGGNENVDDDRLIEGDVDDHGNNEQVEGGNENVDDDRLPSGAEKKAEEKHIKGGQFLKQQAVRLKNAPKTELNREQLMDYHLKMLAASKTGEMPEHDYAITAYIIHKVTEVIKQDPLLIEEEGNAYIIGDLHGNLDNLSDTIDITDFYNSDYMLVFLGDYVDRGKFSLETIMALAALKILYPRRVFLLRGNHESTSVNRTYGFYEEVVDRMNEDFYCYFAFMFAHLSVCFKTSIKGGKTYLCMHGGIPPGIKDLEEINNVPRPIMDGPDHPIIAALTWSDPGHAQEKCYAPGSRGGNTDNFNKVALKNFCDLFKLDGVFRAHQLLVNGFQQFGTMLISIFSATSYEPEKDILNAGAFLSHDENGVGVYVMSPGKMPDDIIKLLYWLNQFSTGFHGPPTMPSMADKCETQRRKPRETKN